MPVSPYDYKPDNWDLDQYVDMSNVYCAVYQEELCGYMAGYAAVKLGYKNLGFLGGMAVPAVIRYGYGFLQGVDAAAAELGLTDVKVNYIYGGQFFGDADITAAMDTWYQPAAPRWCSPAAAASTPPQWTLPRRPAARSSAWTWIRQVSSPIMPRKTG